MVQKHAARRLHYDFRLEVDGVLKSWPIPRGPSYDPHERRLAVMTEDHPLDYASFEGVIPKGEYGGGEVIVWDAGIYAPEDRGGKPCFDRARAEQLVRKGIEQGRLTVFLHGHKLRGMWSLVHTQDRDWLFFKKEDGFANTTHDVLTEDASVLSGLRIEDLKAGRSRRARAQRQLMRSRVCPRAGPLPKMLSPMLPSLGDRAFAHPNWVFEPKLDGYRVLAIVDGGNVQLYSRRGLDCSSEYPWLVQELKAQPYHDIMFDGEIVALDENGRPSFQLMQNRARSRGLPAPITPSTSCTAAATTCAASSSSSAKKSWRRASSDRPAAGGRNVSRTRAALFEAAQKSGMEGIVAKRRDSKYETGRRSDAWIKIKATYSDEFVVGGYTGRLGLALDDIRLAGRRLLRRRRPRS